MHVLISFSFPQRNFPVLMFDHILSFSFVSVSVEANIKCKRWQRCTTTGSQYHNICCLLTDLISRDNVVNHLLVPTIPQCHSDITIMKENGNKCATPSDLQDFCESGNFLLHDSIVYHKKWSYIINERNGFCWKKSLNHRVDVNFSLKRGPDDDDFFLL